MDINKVIYRGVKVGFMIMLILLIVYGTMKVSFTAFDFGYRVFTESAIDKEPGEEIEVTIKKSMDDLAIGQLLVEKGLVRDPYLFWLQYKLSAYAGEIVPGTYTLSTAMEPREMMIIMAENYGVENTEGTENTESKGK